MRYEACEVLERWLDHGLRFAVVFCVWIEVM